MKWVLIVLSFFRPRLCADCKFNQLGKCMRFGKKNENIFFIEPKQYYGCNTSREFEHLCGKKGKYYRNKWG